MPMTMQVVSTTFMKNHFGVAFAMYVWNKTTERTTRANVNISLKKIKKLRMLFILIVFVLLFVQRHRFACREIEEFILFSILLLFETVAVVVLLHWLYNVLALIKSCVM